MYDRFYPGRPWLDTNGNRIQAHGGSVLFLDGVYYWYGENKEKTDGLSPIWHWGVRCYSSVDLYNWEDRGLLIPPEPEDETSSLHPNRCMDRPHILYNAKTKKFVCWLKMQNPDQTQSMTVLTADNLLGPYTKVRENWKPHGMNSGDFDLAVAPDGKAYYYFEKVHTELICTELTDDYLDVTGRYTSHFPHPFPPFVREAPAHFERKGKHYLITSGTTGYSPNPSEVAIADDWHGPFRVLGDPHPLDASRTSYHSQVSSVFKVQGKKDLYIACADRWLPERMDERYEEYAEMYETYFDLGVHRLRGIWKLIKKAGMLPTPKRFPEFMARLLPPANTQIADYVWLPIRFDGEMAYLDWQDEWRLEDYE